MSSTALYGLPRPALLDAASEATHILDHAFPARCVALPPLLDATLPRWLLVQRVRIAALVVDACETEGRLAG